MVATPQKVDLNHTYPCPNPCCQSGKLQPITLTQAWGCFQCQQIFAPTSDFLEIESLTSSPRPGHSSWYWQGQRWVKVSTHPPTAGLGLKVFILTMMTVITLAVLPLLLEPDLLSMVVKVLIFLVIILAVVQWCLYGQDQ